MIPLAFISYVMIDYYSFSGNFAPAIYKVFLALPLVVSISFPTSVFNIPLARLILTSNSVTISENIPFMLIVNDHLFRISYSAGLPDPIAGLPDCRILLPDCRIPKEKCNDCSLHLFYYFTSTGLISQISSAYCLMVRSLEKKPDCAMFTRHILAQSRLCS